MAEEQDGEQAGNRRGRGGKFVKGVSGNPAGRGARRQKGEEDRVAALERENEELREKLADRGLREENKALKGRVKELEAEGGRLRAENDDLRAELEKARGGEDEADPGTDAALGLIEKLLTEAGDG